MNEYYKADGKENNGMKFLKKSDVLSLFHAA